jgi:hypothetical protein
MAQVQRIKVLRAFRHGGNDIGVGSVLELDTPTAQELRGAKKVEFVAADTAKKILPHEKKEKPAPAAEAKLEQLTTQVTSLTEQVSTLAELVEKLVTAKTK